MYYYATTIRKVEKPAFPHYYESLKQEIATKYPKAKFIWHYEGDYGLHLHGMIETPTKIYINKLHPGKGWNVDHQLVKNKSAWMCYITSQNGLEQQLLTKCLAEERAFYEPHEQGERVPFRDLDAQTYNDNSRFKHVNLFTMHPLGSASPTPSNI